MAGASILAGIAIGIGLVLVLVPGLYLITIWCVIVPVIVLERAGTGAGFSRSQQLVKRWEGETMIVDITRKVPPGDKFYEWFRK